MVKRIFAQALVVACSLSVAVASAEEPAAEAGASTTAGASATIAPQADPATSARPASVEAEAEGPVDQKSFWDIIGEDNPNPATYEVGFVGIGLNKAWGIVNWSGGGFYFGAGGGIGSNLYRISNMSDDNPNTLEEEGVRVDPTLELAHGNIFFRLAPFKYLDWDVGGRLALGASTWGVPNSPRGGAVRGIYTDLRIGSAKVKFGPRFEWDSIQYSDYVEKGWKITPLMVRVVND